MKLNPFAKKTGAYYAKVKAQYDDLSRQLDKARDALEQAKIDHDKKEKHAFKLNQQGSMYYSTPAEKEASLAASKASNLVSSLESDVRSLMHRVSPLVSIVYGPQTFEDDKRKLSELQEHDRTTQAECERLEASMAKLTARIETVQARIATEMQTATQTLIDAEGDFAVPEALAKAEAELRLAQASMTDLQGKRDALHAELAKLPEALRSAERALEHSRATMAEIELHEALLPLMDLFARAAVARKVCHWGSNEQTYQIEIPFDNLEAARKALGVRTDD
jgi:chaperonin cofactor prefoldin